MSAKPKILITDDSEMNRAILAEILSEDFDILEAGNGEEAVVFLQQMSAELSLVLLDVTMPIMDGFDVLALMNRYHFIENIPVIMISAENSPVYVRRAYELGAIDYISRPFDSLVVHRRVMNTIMLYAKQKKLSGMVADQIYEKEKSNRLMVSILSHIVEFRNGESGLHVLHINALTELLLRHLCKKTDRYHIDGDMIALISMASALHDIGKIVVPDEILNKPGKLTQQEFEVMKTHAMCGASMLESMPLYEKEPLVHYAYEICRWHHERYDGRGYPDGLMGEEIPISAQIVSLADVYDALTSKRCYKKAFSHEESMRMILEGECGAFNPLLLECLKEASDEIQNTVLLISPMRDDHHIHKVAAEMMRRKDLSVSERTLRLLEHERTKSRFFASMSKEIQFEYAVAPPMLSFSDWGAQLLRVPEVIVNPQTDARLAGITSKDVISQVKMLASQCTPDKPVFELDCLLNVQGNYMWHHVICRTMWTGAEPPIYEGFIGKIINNHEERVRIENLRHMAEHDPLTGLLNHAYARERILKTLDSNMDKNYALAIIDMDLFKEANDRYGHIFGDQVLRHVAQCLQQIIRRGDIAARVGGDEFMVFLEYKDAADAAIDRIFRALSGEYNSFIISVSMGVSTTQAVGYHYAELFHSADKALYSVKRVCRSQYRFYDESMQDMLSALCAIDEPPTD